MPNWLLGCLIPSTYILGGKTVKRKIPIWVTFVLIFASIGCMAFGIYRGELDTVLSKAINICMECIGLG